MKVKKITSLIALFAFCITTLAPQPTITASAATKLTDRAVKVPAVALGAPYNCTLSIQDNKLILSGSAPDYIADSSLQVEIIKPVNYASCTIDSDGRAIVGRDATKAIKSVLKEVGPLDTVSGYSTLWQYKDAVEPKLIQIYVKRLKAFVGDLVERNPDLDHSRTSTLLCALYNLGDYDTEIDLTSTTSIVKAVLDTYPTIDLSYNLMDVMLSAAPKVATVVKTIKHPLTCTNDMAPIIPVTDPLSGKSILTLDLPNVPKIDLDSIADGVYNIRVGITSAPLDKIYHDDILIVIKGGKASLQIINPTYNKYEEEGYTGYTLSQYLVQPAITASDYDNWIRGLPYGFEKE
jgi:hypothetical protein